MPRILIALALVILSLTPAEAQKTKAQLNTEVSTNFPDNTSGAITPAILRTTVNDMIASWQQYGGVNAQTVANYTVQTSDYGQLITVSNASPIAVTLPQPISSFQFFSFFIQNIGSTTATVTPVSSTINGTPSLSVLSNSAYYIVSDGTNWKALSFASPGSGTNILPLNNTWTGSNAFSPASGNAISINTAAGTLAQGLTIGQSSPNSSNQGSSTFNFNSITVADGVNLTGGAFTTALNITQNLRSNILGQKAALSVNSLRTTAPTASTGDQIGIVTFMQVNQTNGGTNTGTGASGSIYGLNPIVSALSGATNYDTFAGGEVDIQIGTGASVRRRFGWSIINADVGVGAQTDGAIEITSSNSTGSFQNGILFTTYRGASALATTACVICTDGGSGTIAKVIDLSSYTISGNVFAFPNTTLSGAGAFSTNGSITANGVNNGFQMSDGTITGLYVPSTLLTHSAALGTTTNNPLAFLTNNTLRASLSAAGAWQWNTYGAGAISSDASGNITAGTLSAANGGTGYTGGAWTTFPATVTPNSGTVSQTGTAAYLLIGKLLCISTDITVTVTSGTPTLFSMAGPPGVSAKRLSAFTGRENALSGKMIQWALGGGIFAYDNTNIAQSGAELVLSNCTEAL